MFRGGCELFVHNFNTIKKHVDSEFFGFLTRDRDFHSLSLTILLSRIDKSIPRLPYLKHLLKHEETVKNYSDSIARLAFSIEGVDAADMSMEIIKWCFEKRFNLSWAFPSDPPQLLQFLEGQSDAALTKYINGYVSNPYRNAQGLAMSILSRRKYGFYDFKSTYLTGSEMNEFHGVLFQLKAPIPGLKLNHKRAAILISQNVDFFFSDQKFIEMDENEDLEEMFSQLCRLRNDFPPNNFIAKYIEYHIRHRRPLCSMALLNHITLSRFKKILDWNRHLQDIMSSPRYDSEYYASRLLSGKFFKKE